MIFSLPYLVARQIDWVIFLLRFALDLTPMLSFALFFICRLIWCILNLLGQSLMDQVWPLSFWVTIGQHRMVCAKTISSWVRKVFCISKAHFSRFSQGAAALAAGVSLAFILQAGGWARVPTPARHYFSTYITTMISTRILYSMLCLASVSRCSLGKCQTLTYIESCVCWAVGP